MSDRQLSTGEPIPEDGSHREIDPRTGQQRAYIVLSAEERAKGFVKPVRRSYRHSCGCVTTMGSAIAETYARDPHFYSGTFCCGCGAHFPLDQFAWQPDGEPMDPDRQEAWAAVETSRRREGLIGRAEQLRREITHRQYELECIGYELKDGAPPGKPNL